MLFKLYQVSDLHISAGLWESAGRHVGGWETFDPHVAARLAEAVQTEAEDLQQREIPFRVVCSGDLSTWGSLDALKQAQRYLWHQSILSRRGLPVALPDPWPAYIPGNHDVWDSVFPLIDTNPRPYLPRTGLENYASLYGRKAAPGATILGKNPFPFRIRLYRDSHLRVLLYGLDTTRLDTFPGDCLDILDAVQKDLRARLKMSERQFRAFRRTLLKGRTDEELRKALSAIAVGYVSADELKRLADMVRNETAEFAMEDDENNHGNRRHTLRLAMIHHPAAYAATPPDNPAYNPDPIRHLRNLPEVQEALQKNGFFGVLCGHQHHGFINRVRPDSNLPPLYVLSCGTSLQRISLHPSQRKLLRRYEALNADETLSHTEETSVEKILNRLNEYVGYELWNENNQYLWRAASLRYSPIRYRFVPDSADADLPIRFSGGPAYRATA